MTRRERFLAFASFRPVDRPPRKAKFSEALREILTAHLGEDPYAHFEMDTPRGAHHKPGVRLSLGL